MSGLWWFVAAGTAALHLSLCVFLVVGGPLGVRRRVVARLHAICFVPVAVIHVLRLDCPVTVAENWARRRAGVDPYDGGFLEHYFMRPLGVGPSPLTSLILGCAVTVPTIVAIWRRFGRRTASYAEAR